MLLIKAEREPWLNCTCSHLHQCHTSFASENQKRLKGNKCNIIKYRRFTGHWILISSVSSLSSVSVAALLRTTNSKHFVLGSSCGNQKEILHAVYITIICLLFIINLILIFVICRMRTRSGMWVFILKAFVLFLILY